MSANAINEHVRQRLRELRISKRIGFREMSEGTGIPSSSYCCMESGYYKINLDSLHRILGVLGASIQDVWPADLPMTEVAISPVHLRRIQDFRLSELISLSEAEGAALFAISGGKSKVLMYQNLSDFLLDRLCLYLEDGRTHEHGLTLARKRGKTNFVLFLKTELCPNYVGKLAEKYLVIWSNLFSDVL